MSSTPEQKARERIDALLQQAGWHLCDAEAANIHAAHGAFVQEAVKPLHDPQLRQLLVELKKKNEITIDHVSQDQVIEAGFSQDALDRARGLVQSFEAFLEEHRDEITALQVL